MHPDQQDGFEDYRRERRRRQLEASPIRSTDPQSVAWQLEEAEAKEAQSIRLTREVQEFFQDATRTAAHMVSQVAETAEREHALRVAQEMSDFLNDTLSRAQHFVMELQSTANPNVAKSEVEANMHNLVGPMLDGFRHEGNTATADNHIGLDPFAVDVDEATQQPAQHFQQRPAQQAPHEPARWEEPQAESAPSPASPQGAADDSRDIEEHLVAELEHAHEDDTREPVAALVDWFERLAAQPDHVKVALRALVRAQVMTRDEAREVWAGVKAQR